MYLRLLYIRELSYSIVSTCGQIQIYGPGKRFTCPNKKKAQIQCRRLPHEWGLRKGKTEASLPPRKICGEVASNPRPGDSVRQLSPLLQACPSLHVQINSEIIKENP